MFRTTLYLVVIDCDVELFSRDRSQALRWAASYNVLADRGGLVRATVLKRTIRLRSKRRSQPEMAEFAKIGEAR